VLGRRPKFVLVGSFESESSPGRHHADLKRKACEAAEIDFEVFEVPWGEPESALVDVGTSDSCPFDSVPLPLPSPFVLNWRVERRPPLNPSANYDILFNNLIHLLVVNKLNAREDIDGLFIQTPFRYNVDFFHQVRCRLVNSIAL